MRCTSGKRARLFQNLSKIGSIWSIIYIGDIAHTSLSGSEKKLCGK